MCVFSWWLNSKSCGFSFRHSVVYGEKRPCSRAKRLFHFKACYVMFSGMELS